jgi:RNA recognition motif-containing protein
VNEDILYAAFIPFGEIAQVLLPKDFTTFDNHRGFGFIEFELPEDARAAIDNLHRSQLYGKTLSCSLAKASQYFSQNALSATSPSKLHDTNSQRLQVIF